MSNAFRKIKRKTLKHQFQTNNISEWFHAENDTLEQKMLKIKGAQNYGKQNRARKIRK